MEIKPIEEIIANIRESYDKEPLGWRLLRGRDSLGHYDTYISNKDTLWLMKAEYKSPFEPKGVGIKVQEKPHEEIELLMQKGSPLPFGEMYQQKNNFPIFTMGVGRYSPSSTKELKGIISSKQENLERELAGSLDKLLHKEGICKEYI
jgi:hypothetical protein